MYINSIRLENIRSFDELVWDLGDKPRAGWHVILGDNGSGKSTFLKALSIAILGAEAHVVVPDWSSYLKYEANKGLIEYDIKPDHVKDIYNLSKISGLPPDLYSGEISLISDEGNVKPNEHCYVLYPNNDRVVNTSFEWRQLSSGWFSAAYGPFRRFTGGDPELERRISSKSTIARHYTLFQEGAALTDCINWLQKLQFKKLEDSSELVDDVKYFINQPGFLPNNIRLTNITSDGVDFEDGNGVIIAIEDLSDGYRSILSMTLELIRHLSLNQPSYESVFVGKRKLVVNLPGVVLIDEIDTHLHPTWQRQIGPWFREHFPKIQFIVTTHSPLVCQAADVGSIFKLPEPDSHDIPGFIEGAELQRLLYGDILDAYSTEVFGSGITRSEKSQKLSERLATLNIKSIATVLSEKERAERDRLRAIFGSNPSILEPGDKNGGGG